MQHSPVDERVCCRFKASIFCGHRRGRQFSSERLAAGHLYRGSLARETGEIDPKDHRECERNQGDHLYFYAAVWSVMTQPGENYEIAISVRTHNHSFRG